MKIIVKEQRVLKSTWVCEKNDCPGEMEFTGNVAVKGKLRSYTHKCSKCGRYDNKNQEFPRFVYRNKEN